MAGVIGRDEAARKFMADGPRYGYGSGHGSGKGSYYGYGLGYGYGSGASTSYGSSSNFGPSSIPSPGSGPGSGGGYNDGSGSCSNDGTGITSFNGEAVNVIDGIPTILRSIHGDVAAGAILRNDLTLTKCYVVKGSGYFAHGDTLQAAQAALEAKILNDMPTE